MFFKTNNAYHNFEDVLKIDILQCDHDYLVCRGIYLLEMLKVHVHMPTWECLCQILKYIRICYNILYFYRCKVLRLIMYF